MVNSNSKKKYIERKFQKNRFFLKPKSIKLRFGSIGILSIREGRLELIQVNFMRKLIKKITKKTVNKINFIREKIWYFGRPNFFLQKKSKNSRMGKGKGSLDRKVLRFKKNFILFEFNGLSIYKITWFLNKINKKSNLRFVIYTPFIKYQSNWFFKTCYSYYYDKYLYL